MMQPCPNTLEKGKQKSRYSCEIAGWIGAAMILFGYYLNANMYTSSWLVWTLGNAIVGVYCLNKKAYPTAVMSFILVIMNIYGYFKWV